MIMIKVTLFKRLALGYLLILLLVILLGVYSISKLHQLNLITFSISAIDSEIARMANRLRDSVLSQRGFEKKYIVSRDIDFHLQFLEIEKYIQKDFEQIIPLIDSIGQKGLIGQIQDAYQEYLSKLQEEVRLIDTGSRYAPERYEREKENLAGAIIRNLDEIIEIIDESIENKIEMSGQISSQASRVAAGITLGSIFMAILIAFFNARKITRPIYLRLKEQEKLPGENLINT